MRDKKFHTAIGTQLQLLRKEKKLTQLQIARSLNITSRAVQYIEAGTTNTAAELLVAYAQTLNKKLSEILSQIGY